MEAITPHVHFETDNRRLFQLFEMISSSLLFMTALTLSIAQRDGMSLPNVPLYSYECRGECWVLLFSPVWSPADSHPLANSLLSFETPNQEVTRAPGDTCGDTCGDSQPLFLNCCSRFVTGRRDTLMGIVLSFIYVDELTSLHDWPVLLWLIRERE